MDGALAFFWLSSWVNCILHILHGRSSRNSFPGSFLARCVLCGRSIVQNSHLYGRNARHFFLTAFASAAYCAAGAHQKTTVCIDGTLANFSILLSDSLGTVRPFCFEKMWSAWAELSPFFLQTTCGLLLRFHHTQRSRDILLWFLIQMVPFWRHFDSFWSHFGVQNGLRDLFRPPGINLGSIWDPGGPHAQNYTVWDPPFLDPFWFNFRQVLFVHEKMWNLESKF